MTKNNRRKLQPLQYTCKQCQKSFLGRDLRDGVNLFFSDNAKDDNPFKDGKKVFEFVKCPNCNYTDIWEEGSKRVTRMLKTYLRQKGWCITHRREMR